MNNLPHKIALVTGASRGIGRAIAAHLAKKSYYVIGTATKSAGAEQCTADLLELNALGEGLVLDVTDQQSIHELMEDLERRGKMPAVLVNNAGITSDNLLLRMEDDEWDRVIETNLNSVYRLSKACLKSMFRARWGRIINIGSIVGSSGNAGQVNYCTAKAGLIGFSKSLAIEIASRGITVNVVAPGFIETDMTSALPDVVKDALLQRIPLKRLGQPDDIAAMVAFLASDEASYVTGQTLHVNGGMYMV